MKRILFIMSILIITGLFLAINVLAQETETGDVEEVEEIEEVTIDEDITAEDLEVADPKILPTNPIYPLKDFWRKVRVKLTFNPIKKAELQLKIANERLIEVKKLAERTGKEQILQKALDKYQAEMEIVKNRIEVFKEKAADNPKIDKFLDKFTDKVIKQERLMDRLEKNLSDKPEVLERIQNVKEKTLEHFGEVMNKLEEKDRIPERLEKNLENIEGSKYKNFKNLEVLLELENKVPEQAKEAIQKAQENALKRLHGDLENMSPEDQEKFKDYLEKISGDQTTHLEIIERLKEKELPDALKEKIEQNREKIQKRIEKIKGACKELCGDGICQEIVCMAIGCPCAETSETCPQDCEFDPELGCVKEGGAIGVPPEGPTGTPKRCCEGLMVVGCEAPYDTGNCPSGCEGAAYCTKCGNGICGPRENKCNCSQDCR